MRSQAKELRRDRLIDDVDRVLAPALPDYDQTLHAVASLAVEWLADVCVVRVDDEDAEAGQRVVVASRPGTDAFVAPLRSYPLESVSPQLASDVRTRAKAEVFAGPEFLARLAGSEPEYVERVRALRPQWALVTPLWSRGRTLGVLTLVRSRAEAFGKDDVRLAEEIGRRAGVHLENARLYRRVQHAVQLRDDLLSVVAHDLRNPLNVIHLNAQVLLRGLGQDPNARPSLREAATRIRDEVARMASLIGELLAAARIEHHGRVSDRARPCSPERLLADAAEALRPLAEAKGLKLEVVVAPDLPPVRADRERIDHVMSNLLGNAIKFTPAGGTITLEASRRGGLVEFAVADTGAGIAPEALPHVFERFWQGRRSDRRGAGLGLWIAQGIVHAHGGTLTAESTVGRGSRFRFGLPCASSQLGSGRVPSPR